MESQTFLLTAVRALLSQQLNLPSLEIEHVALKEPKPFCDSDLPSLTLCVKIDGISFQGVLRLTFLDLNTGWVPIFDISPYPTNLDGLRKDILTRILQDRKLDRQWRLDLTDFKKFIWQLSQAVPELQRRYEFVLSAGRTCRDLKA